jgi:hypothetical protein
MRQMLYIISEAGDMTKTAAFHLARQAVKLTGDTYYVVEGRRHRDWAVTHKLECAKNCVYYKITSLANLLRKT